MNFEAYREALDDARSELARLGGERDALDVRIARLRQAVAGLAALCDETPELDLGLADGCRTVLRAAPLPLTPVQVRDTLAALGLDLDRYANPMAVVHTTLKRLASAGEARCLKDQEGLTVYRWGRLVHAMAMPNGAPLPPIEELERLYGEERTAQWLGAWQAGPGPAETPEETPAQAPEEEP